MNRVIKFFLNDKMALLWAIFVEIIVHGIFALGALLFGAFLGELILVHLFGPIGEQVGAWLFALFIFCAAFQAFVLGEYTRDQVKAYERSSMGDGSYYKSWQYNRWLVGSLELSSLLFRCYITSKDGDLVQAGLVLLFGVLALVYAFFQAKIIHACVNRPAAYDAHRTQESLKRDIVSHALNHAEKLRPSEKAAYIGGNVGVLDRFGQGWFASFRDERRQRSDEKASQKAAERDEQARKAAMREQREADGLREGEQITNSLIPQAAYPFMQAQANDLHQASQNGLGLNGHH
jgi:ABC-type multidrug transport system fused ATPase/permease subunit